MLIARPPGEAVPGGIRAVATTGIAVVGTTDGITTGSLDTADTIVLLAIILQDITIRVPVELPAL